MANTALEIERRYQLRDPERVRARLAKCGAVGSLRLLCAAVFRTPGKPLSGPGAVYTRVRSDGRRVFRTAKVWPDSARNAESAISELYPTETEEEVPDFGDAVARCGADGLELAYFVEKLRETFRIGGVPASGAGRNTPPATCSVEVVFDEYPGLPPFMEIEAPTEEALLTLAAALGVSGDEVFGPQTQRMYAEIYGIPPLKKARRSGDLTFETAFDALGPAICRSHRLFYERLGAQRWTIKELRLRADGFAGKPSVHVRDQGPRTQKAKP